MTTVTENETVQALTNPFLFSEQEVRTAVGDDGKVWFCARDVFEALGLSWKGGNGLSDTPEKWVMVLYLRTIKGPKPTYFLSEPAVYRTIFRSRKPEASAFADWVCEEVLPSIRKQGFYGTVPAKDLPAYFRQITTLTDKLAGTKDAYQRRTFLALLRRLHRLVGEPMPDPSLLGQDPNQLSLGGL